MLVIYLLFMIVIDVVWLTWIYFQLDRSGTTLTRLGDFLVACVSFFLVYDLWRLTGAIWGS